MKTTGRKPAQTFCDPPPLPLAPCGCQRAWGARKRERTRMVGRRGCRVGWGGVVYVRDSVDGEMCGVGVWACALTAAGGAGWQRAHVRVSVAWSGPRARGSSAIAARVRALGSAGPGPPGRGALARGRESRVKIPDRSEAAPGQVRSASAGEGGDAPPCLLACLQPTVMGPKRECRVPGSAGGEASCGSWALKRNGRHGSVGGSCRGSLGMLMGDEPPPLPSLPLCKSSPGSLRCLRRG